MVFSNPEREKRFLYPKVPYGYSMTGLIVNESEQDIQSLDDMTSKSSLPSVLAVAFVPY
ncbi:hypothetical protein OE903_01750 [Bacillus sp. B6(2022)]|nr:hypothetical protein [Bacillus sp. B6(2022)]